MDQDEEDFRRCVRLEAMQMAFDLSRTRQHVGGLAQVLKEAGEIADQILKVDRATQLLDVKVEGRAN